MLISLNIAPSATITATATQGDLGVEGEAVKLSSTLAGASLASPSNGYDPAFQEVDYFWEKIAEPVTEPSTWSNVTTYSQWNNRQEGFGPEMFFVPRVAGTHTWRVTAYHPSFGTVSDSVSVTVASRASIFDSADTYVVSNVSNFTGAPAHDGTQEYTTISAALSAAASQANPVRISIRGGETHVISAQLTVTSAYNNGICIDTYGTGAATLQRSGDLTRTLYASGSFAGVLLLDNLTLDGGWDADTETGFAQNNVTLYRGIVLEGANDGFYTLTDVAVDGHSMCYELRNLNTATGTQTVLDGCTAANWRDYGMFGADGSNAEVALLGISFRQSLEARMGGGPKDGARNDHGPLRLSGHGLCYILCSDMYARNGWTPNAGAPSAQPCIRWNSSGIADTKMSCHRMRGEGGFYVIASGPQNSTTSKAVAPCLFTQFHLLGTSGTWAFFNVEHAGLVARDGIMTRANVPDTNLPFEEFIQADLTFDGTRGDPANIEDGELRVYNCTMVNLLVDPANTTIGFTELDDNTSGGGANITVENNVHYGPDLATPVAPQGTLTRTSSGWTGLYPGDIYDFSGGTVTPLDTSTASPANTSDIFELPSEATISSGLGSHRDFYGDVRSGVKSRGALEFA